jgi:Arc/MetJ-type ribon-helix-helix transcriptional regulator
LHAEGFSALRVRTGKVGALRGSFRVQWFVCTVTHPVWGRLMTKTIRFSIDASLREFVASHVGDAGTYETASEYIRDLIRRDKRRADGEALEKLKAEVAGIKGKDHK